jgi:hypothetical protein
MHLISWKLLLATHILSACLKFSIKTMDVMEATVQLKKVCNACVLKPSLEGQSFKVNYHSMGRAILLSLANVIQLT